MATNPRSPMGGDSRIENDTNNEEGDEDDDPFGKNASRPESPQNALSGAFSLTTIDDANKSRPQTSNVKPASKSMTSSKKFKEDVVQTSTFRADLLGNEMAVEFRPQYKCLKAHLDAIVDMITLADQGCILTTSHDGYQRVWNIDGM